MAATQENYQLYKRYVKNIALIYQRRKDVRAYIELLLSLSVVIIFSIFAIRPTIITIIDLNREIEEKSLIVSRLDNKLSALDQASTVFNQNRRTIALADTAIPDGPLPELYARQMEGLARKNEVTLLGMTIDRVSISAPVNPTGAEVTDAAAGSIDSFPTTSSSILVTLDVTGNFTQLLIFLQELERMRRPTFFDQVDVRLRNETNGNDLILSVTGRVPYIPD